MRLEANVQIHCRRDGFSTQREPRVLKEQAVGSEVLGNITWGYSLFFCARMPLDSTSAYLTINILF